MARKVRFCEKVLFPRIHMLKRSDAKGKIGLTCMYYMVVIEIATGGLDDGDEKGLIKDVTSLVQKVKKRVSEEDEMKTTAFVTVDNIWVVDRLREERDQFKEERDQLKEENDQFKKRIEQLERQVRDSKSKED
ncbi:MAG: hypothetical protein ACFFCS_02250 [Candidatus Hodarchaeota archaeon]